MSEKLLPRHYPVCLLKRTSPKKSFFFYVKKFNTYRYCQLARIEKCIANQKFRYVFVLSAQYPYKSAESVVRYIKYNALISLNVFFPEPSRENTYESFVYWTKNENYKKLKYKQLLHTPDNFSFRDKMSFWLYKR